MTQSNALDLLDAAIADLEAKLNLAPGQSIIVNTVHANSPQDQHNTAHPKGAQQIHSTTGISTSSTNSGGANKPVINKNKHEKKKSSNPAPSSSSSSVVQDQPDICKLEFKVGKIIKAWVHPEADKLYCEEIDVGEEKPRLIASGLRRHYTLEEMQNRRVVVVSNLKAKKLAGFASFGMVLCAAAAAAVEEQQESNEEHKEEKVEFIEPPEGAKVGEVITFQGLPPPQPFSGAQVEKKKIFQTCAEGMTTTEEGLAAWKGHVFMTSAGPCKSATICNGAMR